MWSPVKIEFSNLFAHKSSSYKFRNNTCTVIFGRNDTDRGLENNGAGKTTLFEAISIALTNESLRAIKKDSFINRDEEECEIIFTLHNPVLKMHLKIVRKFYKGNKSSKVEIWENGVLNKQIVSVNEANKRITDLIGVSREDLLRYFIISQDNRYTFFTANDVEKKEVINRITSADMINPIIEKLNSRYKEKSDELQIITDELNKVITRKEVYEEQLEEILASDTTDEELALLDENIKTSKKAIKEANEEIADIESKIKIKEKKIKEIQVKDVEGLRVKVKKLKKDNKAIDDEILETKKIIKTLKSEIEDTITCPKCNHEFIHESELELSLEEANVLLKNAEEVLLDKEKIYNFKSDKISSLEKTIEKAEENQEKIDELEMDKKRLIKRKNALNEEIDDENAKIEKWKAKQKELKEDKKNNETANGLRAKIEECKQSIDATTLRKVQPLENELNLIKFWQFNMGKSGFMTYLANKSIKIIEGITNSFLRKFKVDISVLINGFKVLKSQEVREKIDVFVSNDGVTAEAFLAKSGGERGRVALAGILGIQHLINLSLNGKGLNLLCFDECFYGMDSKGQENIIKIFEKMGITIMVITQNVTELFNNENTLYVVKENDVSRYI